MMSLFSTTITNPQEGEENDYAEVAAVGPWNNRQDHPAELGAARRVDRRRLGKEKMGSQRENPYSPRLSRSLLRCPS